LIDYQLKFEVPNCGTETIYWKKLCGNPLVNREGLYIDMQFKNLNTTIVREGLIVNASYFDDDLENFVFTVP
jgi:hypothetical protein